MAQGDEWRLPGLGKFYCTELPDRKSSKEGAHRSLDSWQADSGPRKKIIFDFVPFRPTLTAVEEEDKEGTCPSS